MRNQHALRPDKARSPSAMLSCGLLTLSLIACAGTEDGDGGIAGPGGPATTGGGEGGTGAGGDGGSTTSSGTGGEGAGGSTGGGGTGGVGGGTGGGGEGGGGMSNCGNGTKDMGEACDGTDFGGLACADLGLSGGTLVCNQFCGINVSGCTPAESCGDGQDNDKDGFFDCEDAADCGTLPQCMDSCFSPEFVSSIPGYWYGTPIGYPDVLTSSCQANPAGEIVLEVESPVSEDIGVNVYGSGEFAVSVRTACDDAGSEIACSDNGQVGWPGIAGETYYIVIEVLETDPFFPYVNADIQIVFPESNCDDHFDDDFDGYLDCDDTTQCQSTPLCTPGGKPTGIACFSQNECVANANDPFCLGSNEGFDFGYCSQFCDLTTNDCGGDGVCADLGLSVNGVCLDGCTQDIDCSAGYICQDGGYSSLVCLPPPELACNDYSDNDSDGLTDCEDPTGCQGTGACSGGSLLLDSNCFFNAQCAASNGDPICLSESFYGVPGGYCSEFCDFSNDCGPDGFCSQNFTSFPSGAGLCFQKCTTSADCAPNHSCSQDLEFGEDLCTPF